MTTPTTTQPAQAGPPADYVPCPRKCGRWTFGDTGMDQTPCWTCLGDTATNQPKPDWSPPFSLPTPASARERRAGQRWRLKNVELGDVREFTLVKLCGYYWETDDPGGIATGAWDDPRFVMTLLADAPAMSEPGQAAKSIETCCTADGCCAECDKCGMRACWNHAGEDHKCAARPAQEAAKAPVCKDCDGDTRTCGTHGCPGGAGRATAQVRRHDFSDRYCADRQSQFCIACGVRSPDAGLSSCISRTGWRGRLEERLTCDAGGVVSAPPELLPRPRLTHSAMWADWAEDVR